MSAHASGLFPVLLGILSDSSDEVVLQGLIVLAEIVNTTNTTGSFASSVYSFISLIQLNFRLKHQQDSLPKIPN